MASLSVKGSIQLSHGKDSKFKEVPKRPSLWPTILVRAILALERQIANFRRFKKQHVFCGYITFVFFLLLGFMFYF